MAKKSECTVIKNGWSLKSFRETMNPQILRWLVFKDLKHPLSKQGKYQDRTDNGFRES